jgi:hypothetical protein
VAAVVRWRRRRPPVASPWVAGATYRVLVDLPGADLRAGDLVVLVDHVDNHWDGSGWRLRSSDGGLHEVWRPWRGGDPHPDVEAALRQVADEPREGGGPAAG